MLSPATTVDRSQCTPTNSTTTSRKPKSNPNTSNTNLNSTFSYAETSENNNPSDDLMFSSGESEKSHTTYQIKIPPIIFTLADWRKTAPKIFNTANAPTKDIIAKISVDGSVRLQSITAASFRYIQSTLKVNTIKYPTFLLPEDRVIKVVLLEESPQIFLRRKFILNSTALVFWWKQ